MTIEEKAALLKAMGVDMGKTEIVFEKNVEYEIGNVEAGGIGVQVNHYDKPVKPDATSKMSGGKKSETKIVRTTFTYRWIEEQESRIVQLYQFLLKAVKWIDKDTDMEGFCNIFRGEDCDSKVKWIGKQSQLYYLIKILIDSDYIRFPKSVGQWIIVQSHFVDKDSRMFKPFNKQKKPKKTAETIEQMAEILNPAKRIDPREFVATLEKMSSMQFDEDDEDE